MIGKATAYDKITAQTRKQVHFRVTRQEPAAMQLKILHVGQMLVPTLAVLSAPGLLLCQCMTEGATVSAFMKLRCATSERLQTDAVDP